VRDWNERVEYRTGRFYSEDTHEMGWDGMGYSFMGNWFGSIPIRGRLPTLVHVVHDVIECTLLVIPL
jgi:hypothetical protein